MRAAPLPSNLEQDIRTEQVRLVFRSMKSSLYLGSALALTLTLVFHSEENHNAVLSWLAAVIVSRVISVGYARAALRRGINAENTSRHIHYMCVIKILEGVAWGSLVWIVMGHTSLAEQLLAMASLAGVSGNAVSLLAPVFPLFLSMQLAQLAAMSSRLLTLEDSSFAILSVGCALFVAGQSAQALVAQRTSRESLILRFENFDLIERLKVESENAELARGKAEEANLAKSKFLAAASHDLRQPVHAQELFLEVLTRSDLSDFQHKILNNARAASQASAQMLNTLLDFSRIEAGVIEPQTRSFRLQPLLHKLENELGGQADNKKIVYRCRETQLAVYSDENLLELMLRNLITNAIRYTETGGLLVGCRKRGKKVVIEVFDTGIGIEPSQQREIFQEFHQLGNPERDRLKGLGLGLAITQGLAQSLDHSVTLSSRPGRGSVFRISLPLATSGETSDTLASPKDSQFQTGLLQGLRILIIDDDEMVREAMVHLLSDWGCDCKAVEHTSGALELVEQWPAEVLISDYRLRENHTGANAIAQIREVMGTIIPALIITGDTAPERLREALQSGLKLLHKPISPTDLYQALAKIAPANRIE